MEDKTIESFGHCYQGHKAVPASGGIRENKRNNAQKDEVLGARAHHGPLIERYCNSAKSGEDKFLALSTKLYDAYVASILSRDTGRKTID